MTLNTIYNHSYIYLRNVCLSVCPLDMYICRLGLGLGLKLWKFIFNWMLLSQIKAWIFVKWSKMSLSWKFHDNWISGSWYWLGSSIPIPIQTWKLASMYMSTRQGPCRVKTEQTGPIKSKTVSGHNTLRVLTVIWGQEESSNGSDPVQTDQTFIIPSPDRA